MLGVHMLHRAIHVAGTAWFHKSLAVSLCCVLAQYGGWLSCDSNFTNARYRYPLQGHSFLYRAVVKVKSTGQATSALCKDTTRRSGIVTPSGDFYAGHERIMTKDNNHGPQHMVPCVGPDGTTGGTSIVITLFLWRQQVLMVFPRLSMSSM